MLVAVADPEHFLPVGSEHYSFLSVRKTGEDVHSAVPSLIDSLEEEMRDVA